MLGAMTPLLPTVQQDACAKCILLGEHAVVYGHPAIAVPLPGFRLRASLTMTEQPLTLSGVEDPSDRARLRKLLGVLGETLGTPPLSGELQITSDIPGSGLGSSAALSVALARLLVQLHGGDPRDPHSRVNEAAYAGEAMFHGRPSGVDNTVVALERPVWFERGSEPIASSGTSMQTMDDSLAASMSAVVKPWSARWFFRA